MKTHVFIFLAAVFAVSLAVFVPPRHNQNKQSTLNAKECTFGPSYWCQNLTSAAGCRAVKHCIQTVWVHESQPAHDPSSICQTCLDMVKQARDQLESNETQELIKEVFEGSCALLHVKQIVKECDKIADEYIPDLIDTLASEMNPQVVCSVAGLCNNALLMDRVGTEQPEKQVVPASDVSQCNTCTNYLTAWKQKFLSASRDDVLNTFLRFCRKTGSYSDACMNYAIVYFNDIYNHIVTNFEPELICDVTQYCAVVFHSHAQIEITPSSKIGYVRHDPDNLPCEFCKQLVVHLRDILIANTTELEFKKVLEGLCKQTKQFSSECLGLVDQYYDEIYTILTNELNAGAICEEIGICPNGNYLEVPIAPLLPVESVPKALEITPAPPKKQPFARVKLTKDGASVKVLNPEEMQLPIDLIMPPHTRVLYNSQICVFCEYFLHYVQQVITNPTSETEIRDIIDRACAKLPSSVNNTCVEFVNMYEPALVAILAQEIDPSQVCPLIKACPSSKSKDVEIFMQERNEDSKCPLCLFAVAKLEDMVKDKKTEANIKDALDKLCTRLPSDLVKECDDFVDRYTNQLVEMLIADLTPQEICVYLKLCAPEQKIEEVEDIRGDTRTNLIIDDTINGKNIEAPTDSPQCVLCEFVAQQLQAALKNKNTDDDIKRAVHNVCNVLPKTIKTECDQFIDQYGDTVIQLLIEATDPTDLCAYLGVCTSSMKQMKVEIFECAICESLVYIVEKILSNPKVDHDVEHVMEKACSALPSHEQDKCLEIVKKYGTTIYDLVIHLADKGLVCKTILLCESKPSRPEILVGANKCSWGPGYWCASKENADICGHGAKQHCVEKVWLAPEPPI